MALSRDKQIGVALVVLAGLGGLAYVQQRKDAEIGNGTKAAADLPSINGSEDVDKISLSNADKGDFTLAKEGDKWFLTKPVHALANQANVKQLIDNLKELKTTEIVASTATEEMKKNYDLDAAHAVHVVAWKGAEQKVDESFGKTGSRGQMVMVGDKPAVYAAKGFAVSLYNREQKGWRDTEVFKFDDANASSITVDSPAGAFSYTTGEKWAGTFKGHAIDRFDDGKVTQMLSLFKGLQADDFGDGKAATETGLDKPVATVTVSLKDNAGKYTLHVGKAAAGTSYYAQKDGDTTVITVSKAVGEWATADESKFQKATDAGAASSATASAKPPPGLPAGHPAIPSH